MRKTTFVLGVLLGALASPAAGDGAADDLAAVRKAVATPARAAEAAPGTPSTRPGDEPRWLRVRVVEKGTKKATVKVNLPLALVRAIGDDVSLPAGEGQGGEDGRGPTLGEVLRALDSGESLVEIEDDEATVRVWVE